MKLTAAIPGDLESRFAVCLGCKAVEGGLQKELMPIPKAFRNIVTIEGL